MCCNYQSGMMAIEKVSLYFYTLLLIHAVNNNTFPKFCRPLRLICEMQVSSPTLHIPGSYSETAARGRWICFVVDSYRMFKKINSRTVFKLKVFFGKALVVKHIFHCVIVFGYLGELLRILQKKTVPCSLTVHKKNNCF